MSEIDNLRLELTAAQLLNDELSEENERLRVENAVLRDKLDQKGANADDRVTITEQLFKAKEKEYGPEKVQWDVYCGYDVSPKLIRKRPTKDRDSGEHPRSPLQRGGR